ncbi:hypothetical protein PFFCH_02330 [Plasmodium falciparum FCH/4]|uniref:Uncharacterized protein n=3 Tax=Plasmodium falciparum TaxID=5833 RepID=W7K4G1_PLAFO|nr:hypothetical protein PFFCH_02330 [Plasmodium falciparum FCH/4]ETW41857.1 hypothetical protein PFNF135_03785 [Plasmodium falciparum NF135/5.C10]EWC87680.1 hypothetical protein PFNF54_03528 [Plasmodium falciparum NF54]
MINIISINLYNINGITTMLTIYTYISINLDCQSYINDFKAIIKFLLMLYIFFLYFFKIYIR